MHSIKLGFIASIFSMAFAQDSAITWIAVLSPDSYQTILWPTWPSLNRIKKNGM